MSEGTASTEGIFVDGGTRAVEGVVELGLDAGFVFIEVVALCDREDDREGDNGVGDFRAFS